MENMTIFSKVITEDTTCDDQTSITTTIEGEYKDTYLHIRHEIHRYYESGQLNESIEIWTDDGSIEKKFSEFLNRMPPGQLISLDSILGGVVQEEIPRTVQMLKDNEERIPGTVAYFRNSKESVKERFSETVSREVRYGW